MALPCPLRQHPRKGTLFSDRRHSFTLNGGSWYHEHTYQGNPLPRGNGARENRLALRSQVQMANVMKISRSRYISRASFASVPSFDEIAVLRATGTILSASKLFSFSYILSVSSNKFIIRMKIPPDHASSPICRAREHSSFLGLIFPLTCHVHTLRSRLRDVRDTNTLLLHIYALWNLPRPRRGVITANRSTRFASCELNILLVTKRRHRVQTTDSRILVHCWTRCWCAFDNSAKPLLIYLFYFRFRRMLNRNALESFLLNENSLIVNNVIDTKSEHSAAQAQPFPSNSLLGLISFCAKGNFYPHSPKPLIRNRRSSPIRTAWQQDNRTLILRENDVTCCQNPSNLFTCV